MTQAKIDKLFKQVEREERSLGHLEGLNEHDQKMHVIMKTSARIIELELFKSMNNWKQ